MTRHILRNTLLAEAVQTLGMELEHSEADDTEALGKIVTILSHISMFAAQAKRHRLAGRMEQAGIAERAKDRLYQKLPQEFRW